MAKRGRRSNLSKISVAALQAELARRQSGLGSLLAQHADLSRQLDSLRAEIEALGGSLNGTASSRGRRGAGRVPAGRAARGRRRRDAGSLVESLAKVLTGKEMRATDAAAAVKRAGYKSKAKNFRAVVSNSLLTSGRFKRTGRGVYTAK